MHTTSDFTAQPPPPQPLIKSRPHLTLGTPPARLFLATRAPDDLWAVSVLTNRVDELLKAAGCEYDQVQLLQGPSGQQDPQWVLLPRVPKDKRLEVQKEF